MSTRTTSRRLRNQDDESTIRDFFTGRKWWKLLRESVEGGISEFLQQNASVLAVAAFTLAKATGVTVKSGNTGLLFSFGRATKLVPPGFRFLIPFLQIVKTIPTRQRTLDLPAQRVTTFDGLVYFVDANLVYQVTDVRKALIEIDDLIKGMRQVLVLSVQEVLRASNRESLRTTESTDQKLAEAMASRLEPWGVELINAGFTSITPSPMTLRLVQLDVRVEARRKGLTNLEKGLEQSLALAMLGTSQRISTRACLLREREIVRRRFRMIRRVLRTEVRCSSVKLKPRQHLTLLRQLRAEAGLGGVLGETGNRPNPAPN